MHVFVHVFILVKLVCKFRLVMLSKLRFGLATTSVLCKTSSKSEGKVPFGIVKFVINRHRIKLDVSRNNKTYFTNCF